MSCLTELVHISLAKPTLSRIIAINGPSYRLKDELDRAAAAQAVGADARRA